MKTIDLVSMATLLVIHSLVGVSSYSFAAPIIQPSSILKINSTQNTARFVVGRISTRHHILVIKSDGLYSVQAKEGKVLAEDITLEQLKDRFPTLHQILETGVTERRSLDKVQ